MENLTVCCRCESSHENDIVRGAAILEVGEQYVYEKAKIIRAGETFIVRYVCYKVFVWQICVLGPPKKQQHFYVE